MTTSATAACAVRAAFTRFIDYAGLFPPAKLEMAPALAEYDAQQRGTFSWMLGRFIVPVSRIPELLDAGAFDGVIALSAIVDAGADPRSWLSDVQAKLAVLAALRSEPRVRVEALEIALPALQTQRETYDAAIGQFAAALKQAGLDTLPAFVELARDARWSSELSGALFALSRHRLCAKLRCGGVVADAFPTAGEVAAFLRLAVAEHRVPFKATAGLHHPIRQRDEATGAMMHGFLNLLAAAVFARQGAGAEDLQAILECEEPRRFELRDTRIVWDERIAQTADLRDVRTTAFVSYGSCSFAEPTADLQALGML